MDTSIGGPERAFPSTRGSLIALARDRQSPAYRRAMDEFCRLYWKPIYAYIRASRSKGNEEAKDLAQEFLGDVVEGELLAKFLENQGPFRAYLCGALQLFLRQEHRDASRLKRGGGLQVLPIADEELLRLHDGMDRAGGTPEEAFDRQWANSILDQAVFEVKRELERTGRGVCFKVFDRYELNPPAGEPPSYEIVAAEFGIRPADISVHLAACRRLLRRRIEERVREYAGEGEVAEEVARLFSS